jgi:predicted ATP-dependent endonuclease of OLD family
MPCSTLNLGCEITTNSEQITGTAKLEDMLKLYETKKQTVPYHLLPNVMHILLKPG